MDIILNQIAIWKPFGAKKLSVRKAPIGQQYREPNAVIYKQATKLLIRYGKDYSVKKVGFSLFLRTECEDAAKVEATLDYYAKQITKEYALQAIANASISVFEYTPYIFNENQTLTQENK